MDGDLIEVTDRGDEAGGPSLSTDGRKQEKSFCHLLLTPPC